MKKFIAIALAVLTVFAFSSVALAEGNTTTLTTTVPDATYTLNIPADQEIAFGATSTDIGTVTVANSSGFAEGKNLSVILRHDGCLKSKDVSTVIPYQIVAHAKKSYSMYKYHTLDNGSNLLFLGTSSGECKSVFTITNFSGDINLTDDSQSTRYLTFNVSSNNWGKALGGEYSSTITFTAEVVSEN